jgi:BlaI family transcriptional regulator, penicillinase repressor
MFSRRLIAGSLTTKRTAFATKYLVDRFHSDTSNHNEESWVPPRKSTTLTEAELRLMDVLWLKGSATVQEVQAALPMNPGLAYNSVLTTIRILEKKGYVKHVKQGRAHVYTPIVERKEATQFAIRNLVSRFFSDSHELLVLNILQDEDIDAEELKRLREMLQQGKSE